MHCHCVNTRVHFINITNLLFYKPFPEITMTETQNQVLEISFNGIIAKDPAVLSDLKKACATHGCFFLTLQESYGYSSRNDILQKVQHLWGAANEFYDMPLNSKLGWEMDKWGEMQIGG